MDLDRISMAKLVKLEISQEKIDRLRDTLSGICNGRSSGLSQPNKFVTTNHQKQ